MTEKEPVVKKRRFKAFLKIIFLPVFMGVIAIAINHYAVLSAVDKKYDSLLLWQSSFLSVFKNATIMRPISLTQEGVIFDEILEPRWTAPFAIDLTYKDKNSDSASYSRLQNGFMLDLLIEIDQRTKDGSDVRIINYNVNDYKSFVSRSNDLVMDSWALPVEADASGLSTKNFWVDFKRGYKYRIKVINQSINKVETNKLYQIEMYSIHSELRRNLVKE